MFLSRVNLLVIRRIIEIRVMECDNLSSCEREVSTKALLRSLQQDICWWQKKLFGEGIEICLRSSYIEN